MLGCDFSEVGLSCNCFAKKGWISPKSCLTLVLKSCKESELNKSTSEKSHHYRITSLTISLDFPARKHLQMLRERSAILPNCEISRESQEIPLSGTGVPDATRRIANVHDAKYFGQSPNCFGQYMLYLKEVWYSKPLQRQYAREQNCVFVGTTYQVPGTPYPVPP